MSCELRCMLKVNQNKENCKGIPLTTQDTLYNVHGSVFLMTCKHQYFTEFIIELLNPSYMSDVIIPKMMFR